MTTSRRIEFALGLLSGLLGFLALGIQFFGPGVSYMESSTSGGTVSGMTSYAQVAGGVVFLIVLFGLPLVGIAWGAARHALSSSASARIVLWVATLLLTVLAVLALLSIGPSLLPAVILAWVASSLALVNRRAVAGAR